MCQKGHLSQVLCVTIRFIKCRLSEEIHNVEQPVSKVEKTEEEWREELTEEQYQVCRLHGTEQPFSGKLLYQTSSGEYVCTCCQSPLFKSDNKYESGCGWPSFDAPISDGAIRYLEDRTHGMVRTEIRCATCDSHLGHVFPDGPKTTGERYCVNSVSLIFNKS